MKATAVNDECCCDLIVSENDVTGALIEEKCSIYLGERFKNWAVSTLCLSDENISNLTVWLEYGLKNRSLHIYFEVEGDDCHVELENILLENGEIDVIGSFIKSFMLN